MSDHQLDPWQYALDLDEAGSLFISFRSLREITKIDTRTGAERYEYDERLVS